MWLNNLRRDWWDVTFSSLAVGPRHRHPQMEGNQKECVTSLQSFPMCAKPHSTWGSGHPHREGAQEASQPAVTHPPRCHPPTTLEAAELPFKVCAQTVVRIMGTCVDLKSPAKGELCCMYLRSSCGFGHKGAEVL